MLSWQANDRPIAAVVGGARTGEVLYIWDVTDARDIKAASGGSSVTADELRRGRNPPKPKKLERARLVARGEAEDDDGDVKDLATRIASLETQKAGKEVTLSTGTFRILPMSVPGQREYLVMTGSSGSGKSYLAGQYCEVFAALWPEKPIYLFLGKAGPDAAYDKLLEDGLASRVALGPEFADPAAEPLEVTDFADSLVVFDDIDNLTDKKTLAAVEQLKKALAELGRSHGVSLVECNHIAANYNKTRVTLNEMTGIVLYRNGSAYHNRRLLREYCGLDPSQIARILGSPTRWVMVNKSHPRYALTETGAWIL